MQEEPALSPRVRSSDECSLSRQSDHQPALAQFLDRAAGSSHRHLIIGRQVSLSGQPRTGRQFSCLDPGGNVVGHSDVDIDRPEGVGVELGHLDHEDHPRTLVNCGKSQDAAYCTTTLYTAL
jgi:hypothetical protein